MPAGRERRRRARVPWPRARARLPAPHWRGSRVRGQRVLPPSAAPRAAVLGLALAQLAEPYPAQLAEPYPGQVRLAREPSADAARPGPVAGPAPVVAAPGAGWAPRASGVELARVAGSVRLAASGRGPTRTRTTRPRTAPSSSG